MHVPCMFSCWLDFIFTWFISITYNDNSVFLVSIFLAVINDEYFTVTGYSIIIFRRSISNIFIITRYNNHFRFIRQDTKDTM